MTRPKVSVCVITFNQEEYIERTLESILNQKFDFAVELILSNDNSNDNTHKKINETLSHYNGKMKITYYHQTKNLGIIPNFYFCLDNSKGDFIALCEGDDYWTDPLKLQKQVDFLEDHSKYSYCAHNAKRLKKGELISNPLKPHKITFDQHIFSNYINTCTLMFRNSALKNRPKIFNKIDAADWAVQLWALKKADGYFMENDMGVYRVHDKGMWNQLSAKEMCMRGVKILKQFKKVFKDETDRENIDLAIAKRRKDFGY